MLVPPRDNPTLQPTSGSSTTTMYSTGLHVLSQGRGLWLGGRQRGVPAGPVCSRVGQLGPNSPPGAMGPGPGPCTGAAICPGAGTPPCMGGCIRGGAPLTCIPPCPRETLDLRDTPKPGHVPSWESWSWHCPSLLHSSCRAGSYLLWAVAGMRGCSVGSAARWALAQAPVLAQALALALAAGCLGSEEEHWSGDAGFSRAGRRRKEFFSTPTPQRLPPLSSQPQMSSKGQTSAISGSTILMTTWACSSA